MPSTRSNTKRKASIVESEVTDQAHSDDEFGDGLLEGVLDDESDDEEEDDDNGTRGSDNDSKGDEDEDALESDDIPTDDEAIDSKQLINGAREDVDDDFEPNYRIETDANGNERYVYDEIDPVYDSDDTDAQEPANTIGNIPLSFYDSYPHIGYDINGKKIMRPATGEALDALLDSIEVPKGWTGLTDPATGKPLNLSRDELELLRRVQMGEVPEEGYDPYPVGTTMLSLNDRYPNIATGHNRVVYEFPRDHASQRCP